MRGQSQIRFKSIVLLDIWISAVLQSYGKTYSHKVNHAVDSNTCSFCFQNYNEKDKCEWMERPLCKNGSMKNVSTNNILFVNI